jgi:hypothetical protein
LLTGTGSIQTVTGEPGDPHRKQGFTSILRIALNDEDASFSFVQYHHVDKKSNV